MLNILIVDDSKSKITKIRELVETIVISGEYELSEAVNAYDAYEFLKIKQFDILVLDIILPMRSDSPPNKTGGLNLLDAIIRDPDIKRPLHIVGLTEHDDVLKEHSKTFDDRLWHLIKYQNSSCEWSNALTEKIIHSIACNKDNQNKKIKLLFLSADPTNQLELPKEAREIEEKLKMSKSRDFFDIITKWAVRIDDILLAFNENKPQIIHFSGHGSSRGELIVIGKDGKDESIPVQGMKKLFETMKGNIKLVLLNACYSEAQAKAIAKQIDFCIGIKDPIDDQAAIEFVSAFYSAIGFGNSIKNSFDQGITILALKNFSDKPKLICRKGCDPQKTVLVKI